VSDSSFGALFVRWAEREPSICAVNLIGSRVRLGTQDGAADSGSDWDFQLVVRRSALFSNNEWVTAAGLPVPLAYVVRVGRLGETKKVSLAFQGGAFDLVLIPSFPLRTARWLCNLGLLRFSPRARIGLTDLSTVLRPGYRLLKGEISWGSFFRYVQTEIQLSRISDEEVVSMAEGFVCDFLSIRHKLARGEYVAAQRWLHMHLAEANFKLLHELRQRDGAVSFPDARRLELIADRELIDSVMVRAVPEHESLQDALEKSALTLCQLAGALTGQKWKWPM